MGRGWTKFAVLASACVLIGAGQPSPRTAESLVVGPGPASKVTRTELAPGVYQFQVDVDGYVTELNSLAVVTSEGVVVFDTTTRPANARAIIAQIRALTPLPVRYVINSHWHPDHWTGNRAYADAFPNAQFIASTATRNAMLAISPAWQRSLPKSIQGYMERLRTELAPPVDAKSMTPAEIDSLAAEIRQARDTVDDILSTPKVFPTMVYSGSMTFWLGGREFMLKEVTGDAFGETILSLPKERIVATADLINGPIPYTGPAPAAHAQAIREMLSLDPQIIVPGHGPAARDHAYALAEAALLEDIAQQTRAASATKPTIEQVQAVIDLSRHRATFAHGDPDLERRFDTFAKSVATPAFREVHEGREYHD